MNDRLEHPDYGDNNSKGFKRYCPVHGFYDPNYEDHSGHDTDIIMRHPVASPGCFSLVLMAAIIFVILIGVI